MHPIGGIGGPTGDFLRRPMTPIGHTDQMLLEVTKFGFASKAPPRYQTDMPAFKDQMSDSEIWDALAYIKSPWPDRLRRKREPK